MRQPGSRSIPWRHMNLRRQSGDACLRRRYELVDARRRCCWAEKRFARDQIAIDRHQREAVLGWCFAEPVHEQGIHRRLRARAGQMRDAALEGGEVFRLAARAFGKPDQDIAAVERIIAGLHGIFLFVAAANSWPPRTMGMMPMIFLADRASAI